MVRVVLAGCGMMSADFLQAVAEIGGIDVVGLVDPALCRAQERRSEFNLPQAAVGPDLLTMIDQEHPHAVFDIVVPLARHRVGVIALSHGCHLLSEKPMADSMANARDLIRVGVSARRIHAVVQNRRYHPGVRRIVRFLRDGHLGRLTGIYCDFFQGPHFGGFREEMQHVLLLDMAIHTFDIGRLFADALPQSVWCREWNPSKSWYAHGAAAIAVFEMIGGVIFSYRGSWCAEGLATSSQSTWRITGECGTLLWDGGDNIRAEVHEPGLSSGCKPVAVPPLDPADRVGGHRGVIEDFVNSIRTGQLPETAASENIKSLAMVFGAIRSAETGKVSVFCEGDLARESE